MCTEKHNFHCTLKSVDVVSKNVTVYRKTKTRKYTAEKKTENYELETDTHTDHSTADIKI
jgi:hypothetical protein